MQIAHSWLITHRQKIIYSLMNKGIEKGQKLYGSSIKSEIITEL